MLCYVVLCDHHHHIYAASVCSNHSRNIDNLGVSSAFRKKNKILVAAHIDYDWRCPRWIDIIAFIFCVFHCFFVVGCLHPSSSGTELMLKMFQPIVVVAVLLLLAGMVADAQRNPSISFISKDKVVNIGDTLELKCQVQDAATYPVSWTILGKTGKDPIFISRGQTIIVPGDRHHLMYEERDSTYTLVVNKVQEIDAGTYRCEVTTSVSGNVSLI